MKRMKKRLLAMLLALMLVVGLLPVGVLAADHTVNGKYVTVNVETGNYTNNLTVNVYDPNGNLLETITSNQARTSDCKISITLKSGEYLIEDVEKTGDGRMVETASTAISSDRKSYNNTWNATGAGGKSFTLNVNLRANPAEEPETPNGIYNEGATVGFRAYIPQMLKLLYCENPSLVNDSTEITGVEMFFRVGFGYGQSESFAYINREEDYFNTELSNATGLAVPSNVSEIRISYRNGDTTGVASIEAGALSFVYHSGAGHYYSIESSNHDINVVYFYNETDGNAGNNYFQYAVRFVEDGKSLGEDMPDDPEYGTGNLYRFVNWEQGSYDGTGAPFFSTTEVNEDLTVFARKVSSSEHGGTEIHVLNENDSLLNRVVELYNAAYTDAPIDIDDIDRESVKINAYDANGKTTNKDYYNNEWRSYNSVEYYWVCNYNVPSGVANLTNTHIGYDVITGINVFFTVGSEEKTVSIPVGEYPGDVAKRHGSTDNIIELLINSAPEKPDDDYLDVDPDDDTDTGIMEDAVTVNCTNATAGHNPVTYDLLPSSFTVGDVYYTSEGYKCDVTVSAVKYVEEYGDSHTLVGEDTATITLIYSDSKWTVPTGATPVTFNVTCDSGTPDPDPEEPRDPTEDELNQLYVDLKCINADAQHAEKRFHLDRDNSYVTVDPTTGICTVEPRYDFILQRYNDQVTDGHTYVDDDERTLLLSWNAETKAWDVAGDVASITRQVECETPEQPGEGETPAITDDDIIGALDGKTVVTIDCNNPKVSHSDKTYKLSDLNVHKAGFCLNRPEQDGDGNWIAKVTIIPGEFVTKYSNDMNDAHKLNPYLAGKDYKTITLKWENKAWVLADQNQIPVTYTVSCDVETEIVEGPGDVVIVPVKPEDPTDPDQTGVSDLLETDDHIQYLFGYPDDSFGPDRNMTRAEAAQMFYNLLKNQNVDAEPAFDDVPDGAWYATAVNVMAELGIVNGVGDNKFEPNREITRAEFTTMAMRFAKVPSGGVNIFTDVAPSDWFYSYVVNSIQYGWIEGYGDGTFRPDRLITRAEVTTIVNRMLDRQADMAFVIQNRDKLTKFTDLTTEHWAYYTIVEATNEHNYKKPAIGEDWTSLK